MFPISRNHLALDPISFTWVKRSKASSADARFTGCVATLDEEKLAMHKQIRELEMERDILKKALGIFSRPM